ncbi:hypothetical protein [Chitinilyticum piscinae]|uniref:Uncharacterized protein n=1 Tax=Chitinilyticum piscinae TaxID=2866724 RepID=A0A8J7FKL3_9NEIS|nr:hypothetical protein [Chitinilyticum piscinae]MBE9609737.1 hypothetical protein [Chitinilyticum piscinae]
MSADSTFFFRLRALGGTGYLLLGTCILMLLLALLLIAGVTTAAMALRQPPPVYLPQELPYHKSMPETRADELQEARMRFQRFFGRKLTFSGYKAQAVWDAVWASCPEADCTIPPAAGARLLLPYAGNRAIFERDYCDYGLLVVERQQLAGAALALGETGCRIVDYAGYQQGVQAVAEQRRSAQLPRVIWTAVALLAALVVLVLCWRKLLDEMSKL